MRALLFATEFLLEFGIPHRKVASFLGIASGIARDICVYRVSIQKGCSAHVAFLLLKIQLRARFIRSSEYHPTEFHSSQKMLLLLLLFSSQH
jgi:hypothetical protein